jgi:D-beta-D-heptose 7-phosphate kinase/D-beta-D-heptose 1-phosphate adenosyltransferase
MSRILVIGDAMIDVYIHVKRSNKISENQSMIMNFESQKLYPGGAANLAVLLKKMGFKVSIMTSIGNDQAGKELIQRLKKEKIKLLGFKPTISTTVKTRIFDNSNKYRREFTRIDHDSIFKSNSKTRKELINAFQSTVGDFDLVCISNYHKGLLDKISLKKIVNICKSRNVIVVCDTKFDDISVLKYIDILKINNTTFENYIESTGISRFKTSPIKQAVLLKGKIGCKNLVVTRANKRAIFISERDQHFYYKPKLKNKVIDVTGAGDVFLAKFVQEIYRKKSDDLDSLINSVDFATGYCVKTRESDYE